MEGQGLERHSTLLTHVSRRAGRWRSRKCDFSFSRMLLFSLRIAVSPAKEHTVWQELVRLGVTWIVMCGLVAFFYWMLGSIGTF